MEKVSIITTYYNSKTLGDFVNKSMQYLLNQTYKNIEFVCVNDGSEDETLKELEEYDRTDSRIKIVNKVNQGSAQYAKAAGQDAATGDFIMLFDHDDIMDLDAIEKAVEMMKSDNDLDMVSLIVKTSYPDGEVEHIYNLSYFIDDVKYYKPIKISGSEAFAKTVGKYDVHFRGICRKELFKSVSYNFERKLLNADEIVERLIFEKARYISVCNALYTHYIFHNSSAKSFSKKRIDLIETDMYLRKLFTDRKIYQQRASIFEMTAYKNFIYSVKTFQKLANTLTNAERKNFYHLLNQAYSELDRKVILEQFQGVSKMYNKALLFNFDFLMKFYKYKK